MSLTQPLLASSMLFVRCVTYRVAFLKCVCSFEFVLVCVALNSTKLPLSFLWRERWRVNFRRQSHAQQQQHKRENTDTERRTTQVRGCRSSSSVSPLLSFLFVSFCVVSFGSFLRSVENFLLSLLSFCCIDRLHSYRPYATPATPTIDMSRRSAEDARSSAASSFGGSASSLGVSRPRVPIASLAPAGSRANANRAITNQRHATGERKRMQT